MSVRFLPKLYKKQELDKQMFVLLQEHTHKQGSIKKKCTCTTRTFSNQLNFFSSIELKRKKEQYKIEIHHRVIYKSLLTQRLMVWFFYIIYTKHTHIPFSIVVKKKKKQKPPTTKKQQKQGTKLVRISFSSFSLYSFE